ncbi:unnamed protein product [Diatraea saccharalis]|uniref:Uncharacterized protein n=1 Tax=Diatraea saccharalis TaxID=40085 RepID=A0A9N9R155_9NEOP|nr:unnamed protein product [Diatraea saccharalis]
MWTTAEEPASCVAQLRHRVPRAAGVTPGHYRLVGDKGCAGYQELLGQSEGFQKASSVNCDNRVCYARTLPASRGQGVAAPQRARSPQLPIVVAALFCVFTSRSVDAVRVVPEQVSAVLVQSRAHIHRRDYCAAALYTLIGELGMRERGGGD